MKHFLMGLFSPERSLSRFIVGTAALTVVVQFIYDICKDNYGSGGAAVLAIILILIVAAIFWLDYQQAHSKSSSRPQETPISPHQGLILLISPNRKAPALLAVEHHLPMLKHCWLLSSQESLETAEELAVEIKSRWQQVNIFPVHDTRVDPENIESTYSMVTRIYENMASTLGLAEKDIVADITGGQKPMTAGMAVACYSLNRKMQYLKALRDINGNLIKDASPIPVLVNRVSREPA